MNQAESTETVLTAETEEVGFSEEASAQADAAADAGLLEEAEGVRAVYPDFDLTAALADPVLGALVRGEIRPTLRQLYEATHLDTVTAGRVASEVQAKVAEAVSAAVAEAVRETEERLLSHIRARGQRPSEVGTGGAAGIRMHPAVNRLTRKERAMLAKRAENGETIQF
jgi:hypothetical protein